MEKKYYLCNLNKIVYFLMKNRIEILKGLHPGVFLQYELDKQNLKSGKFAESIGEHPQTLSAIIRGRRSMNIPLSLRIENALNLEEGLLMTLQVYYDIAQEKLKLVKKNKPDLSKFRSVLFWDTSLENIDFDERECVVLGKGDKERVVYFDARTKIHLQNYLSSRLDDNPALFVSLKSPYKRLQIGGVEVRLRELGRRLDINKVHPHKFRRTLATVAIDKGMPIEQLQQLLGHQKIDTTLQYAMVKQSNVKMAHKKYIG